MCEQYLLCCAFRMGQNGTLLVWPPAKPRLFPSKEVSRSDSAPPQSPRVWSQHHLLLGLPRRARHVVSRFALVLAEGAHLVLVLSTPCCLQVCVGNWGWGQAHELTQGLGEGPQSIFHTGQHTVVAWKTQASRVSRGMSPPEAKITLELPESYPT